jgi:arylsulfatase A-like enzyme
MSAAPNVIVFFTDQQRWDSCGLHGNPLELTPNYDRYARAGTHLRYAFTPAPLCGPARSCMQTGFYATETGCWRNGIPLKRKHETLATHFNAAGYETGYIGKWHLGAHRPRTAGQAVQQEDRGGYQRWLGANLLEYCSDAYDCRLYDEEDRMVQLPGYRVDAVADAGIRFVTQPRERPYFLFLSFLEPHHQNQRDDFPAPVGYEERYRGRWMPSDLAALPGSAHAHLSGYWGMVKRLDEAFGRLMDALRSSGQLDSTIVCFTSDHGCHFKTRNAEYKRSGHDSSIRIPAFLHGPGFMSGGDRSELVSLLDLPPTLLEAAGIPVPPEMAGRSLLALLRQPAASWNNEIFVQISSDQVGRALRTRRWKYGVSAPAVKGDAAASAERYEEVYLYDVANDPYELCNLLRRESHAAVAAGLRARLQSRIAKIEGVKSVIEACCCMADGQPPVIYHELD